MAVNVGNAPIKRAYIGSTPLEAIYVGSTLVWQASVSITSMNKFLMNYWDPASVVGNQELISEWSGVANGDLRGMVTFNVDVRPSTIVYRNADPARPVLPQEYIRAGTPVAINKGGVTVTFSVF